MKKKIGSALVVGAGISGIRSALDLAEQGYRVALIDKAPHLGGVLSQLDVQFPTDHCGMCRMLPLVERDASSQFCLRKGLFHENIDLMLSTELTALEGEPGKFQATLRQAPAVVDPQRCIGCGACSEVCPMEVPDAFNAGLTRRKAIYLPVPHNIPNTYVVDAAACNLCGACEEACPTGAVDFGKEARGKFRILVVDDELVVRDSLKEWLEDEGFGVDMAGSGEEALEKLREGTYNLMLLDIKMPGMDGVEVLKRARDSRPELPVVMMTAYATVETAVEAMKIGALDYLMKPFDPDSLVPLIVRLYQNIERADERHVEVGAVILAAGFESYDPAAGKNPYGYGVLPNVITSLEFERLVSGTGPYEGRLLRPGDGREIRRIAWLQCVGSRDQQAGADFCSSACCMFAIKEALLAKEKSDGQVETSIFYMDMRTFGKDFQRYRDAAEKSSGVSFRRSRVHSLTAAGPDGDVKVAFFDEHGAMQTEIFDLVVLAAGQRPAPGTEALAETTGVALNPWGFCRAEGFSRSRTSRDGVHVSGSFSGLRDISDSVIQAGSASLEASRWIHSKGGGLAQETPARKAFRDVSRELARTGLFICSCGGALEKAVDLEEVAERLKGVDSVDRVRRIQGVCTRQGWEEIREALKAGDVNRVLIGACMPYVYTSRLRELGATLGLDPALMDVVDIRTPALGAEGDRGRATEDAGTLLSMGAGRLKGLNPAPKRLVRIEQKALVVGGGIAGMTAALAIADHGFEVSLVEKAAELGGNLRRLHRTIEGDPPQELLADTLKKVESHPKIEVYRKARVLDSVGRVGRFSTVIEKEDGSAQTLRHAVAVLATGGKEAGTQSYGYGQSGAVLTQQELEGRLADGSLKPEELTAVAMIQCVDSREEPRNYCSRVCCSAALKNALYLKERNPDIRITVYYRDMMAYGFLEAYYTEARNAGVVFVPYRTEDKPRVTVAEGRPRIAATDTILGRELVLEPDLLVLGTGIEPNDAQDLAALFGVERDRDGFFQEADYKWRPVDFLREGVFTAGIAHSPRSLTESVAMGQAAAQRCLRILSSDRLAVAHVVAEVRSSLCSLCERCVDACPYGARIKDEEEAKIIVDELMCQGCGSCAAVCPNSASVLRGFEDRQVFEVIDAALETAL